MPFLFIYLVVAVVVEISLRFKYLIIIKIKTSVLQAMRQSGTLEDNDFAEFTRLRSVRGI